MRIQEVLARLLALGCAALCILTFSGCLSREARDGRGTMTVDSSSMATSPSAIEPHLRTFFDRDQDRMISLGESYRGVRELGIGRVAAVGISMGINLGLGQITGGGPLTVNLDNISRGKHPGDSRVIKEDGQFDQQAFDEIFARHALTFPDALTAGEVAELRRANHKRDSRTKLLDKVATLGEFGLLFRVGAQDRDGVKVLTRERLLDFYTSDNLFETIAAERRALREERAKSLSGSLKNFFNTWIF